MLTAYPLSKPSLATVTLFCIVAHWNSWFDGLLYMNSTSNYPLQSYLQTIIVNPTTIIDTQGVDDTIIELLDFLSDDSAQAAQLFVSTIPILAVYPFLQKYFATGLVLGSVKE